MYCFYEMFTTATGCTLVFSADGANWPAAEPTDIPDSPSLSTAVSLENGTVLLAGNHVATEFYNPQEVSQYTRNPLTLSVSSDGYIFKKAFALRKDIQKHRIPGVMGRGNGGGQYPTLLLV